MTLTELLNRLVTSDLVRWYGWRIAHAGQGTVELWKPGRYRMWIDYDGDGLSVHVLGTDEPQAIAKAKWIEGVLMGKKRDDEGG